MKKESIKHFIWGLFVGAIALLNIVYWSGWMVTKSSANQLADRTAETAVIDKLVPICVAQFQQDPNKEALLKELKEKRSYHRGDYVKEKGWATMLGSKYPDSKIADQCAKRIVELSK